MAQFDVFVNPVPSARLRYPFVVAMQSDFAANSEYQLVAPIAPRGAFSNASRLTPKIEIQGKEHVVLVPQMTLMRSRNLTSNVSTLGETRSGLLAAIDLLFFGV